MGQILLLFTAPVNVSHHPGLPLEDAGDMVLRGGGVAVNDEDRRNCGVIAGTVAPLVQCDVSGHA